MTTPALITDVQKHLREFSIETGKAAAKLTGEGRTLIELPASTGVYAGPSSPLTQAAGKLPPEEIRELRGFFESHGSGWEAGVNPFSHPEALDTLYALGGLLQGWEQTMGRELDSPERSTLDPSLEIVESGSSAEWLGVATAAFFGEDSPPELVLINQIMGEIPNSRFYIALHAGQAIAAASACVFNDIVHFGGMATLPDYRGKGIQSGMIERRLRDFASSARFALTGCDPTGISRRNAERAGFQMIFGTVTLRVPAQG